MRKDINSAKKNISATIIRVQPGHKSFSSATSIVQPVSTISHRVNKGPGQNVVRPVYAEFEFLP